VHEELVPACAGPLRTEGTATELPPQASVVPLEVEQTPQQDIELEEGTCWPPASPSHKHVRLPVRVAPNFDCWMCPLACATALSVSQ
jgi:hypothetical protein